MRPPWERSLSGWERVSLPVAEVLYSAGVRLRRLAYDLKLRRRYRMPLPVVCVGNLTVGGTGKTPAVIAICQRLVEWGHRPAVVSRGYGSDREPGEIQVVSPDATDWRTVGDEPLLLARSLSGVPVVTGVDRVAAAQRALACPERPTVLVLDDGFQHWRLVRDLDIVLLDGTDPFGNGRLLPRGPLREPLIALRRAGLVVLTKANLGHETGIWQQRLGNRLEAPVVQAIHRPVRLMDLATGQARPVEDLRRKRIVAVSGLARNETFPALLTTQGAIVEAALGFEDHQVYSHEQWTMMRDTFEESGAEAVVTTAKDAVKWTAAEIGDLPLWVLEIGFEIRGAEERFWSELKQRVGEP
jgi:tetraacyldisaccharide 4'-kinase